MQEQLAWARQEGGADAALASSRLLPEEWQCAKHDKILMKAVSDKGIACLEALESDFPDLEVPPTADVCFKRLEEVCEFFKQMHQQGRTVKKLKREYPE